MPPHTDAEASALLDAVGPAFSKLRRSVLLEVENPVSAKDMARTLVLAIVETGEAGSAEAGEPGSEPEREVTVGAVADQLSVDPSVASRMVSDCIAAGYLERAASQHDGRRTILRLRPEGAALMSRFRQHQRRAFEYITVDWAERDRLEFARLMLRYVDAIGDLRRRGLAGDAPR
jgi:DNA-binding MarR family transcriptional regulator